jgi:hypothetical protein
MRLPVARFTESDQPVKRVRIRHPPSLNVMNRLHLGGVAKLAHPTATFPHLPPTFRVNSIPPAPPVRHRLHVRPLHPVTFGRLNADTGTFQHLIVASHPFDTSFVPGSHIVARS